MWRGEAWRGVAWRGVAWRGVGKQHHLTRTACNRHLPTLLCRVMLWTTATDWGSNNHFFEDVFKCCGLQGFGGMCPPRSKHVYMTVLREPLEHMLSFFFYSMSKQKQGLYSARNVEAKGYASRWPTDFMEWLQLGQHSDRTLLVYRRSLLAEFFRGAVVALARAQGNDPSKQTHRLFSSFQGDGCYVLNKTHLEMAQAELKKVHVIGLQERLDESLVWAATALKWDPSEMVYSRKEYVAVKEASTEHGKDAQLVHQNTNKIANRPTASELPAAMAAQIRATPRYKLEKQFYNFAVGLHNQRTSGLPGFKAKVAQFVEACNHLGAQGRLGRKGVATNKGAS